MPEKLPLQVTVEVEGGVVQYVFVCDAAGEPVPFELTITDHDVEEDEDA